MMAGKSTNNHFPEEQPRRFLRHQQEPQQHHRRSFLHNSAAQNTNHHRYSMQNHTTSNAMQNHTTSNATNKSHLNLRIQRGLNSDTDMRFQQLPQRTAAQGGYNHQFGHHEQNLPELLLYNSVAHNSIREQYVMPNFTTNNNDNRIANIISNSHTNQIEIQQSPDQNVADLAVQGVNHQQLGQSFLNYTAEQNIGHQDEYIILSDFQMNLQNEQYPLNQQTLLMADGEITPPDIENLLESIPAGFRFVPSNEELVKNYLMKKLENKPLPCKGLIHEVQLYAHDPRELIEKDRGFASCWYYFTPRDKKYPKGSRPRRSACKGYWKAAGKVDPIFSTDGIIGYKLVLDFYEGKYREGKRTDLKMHEYRVHKKTDGPSTSKSQTSSMQLDDLVLCKIYKVRRGDNGNDQPPGDDAVVSVDDNITATPEEESPLNSQHTTLLVATAAANNNNNNNNVMQQNNLTNDTPNSWETASTSTSTESRGIDWDQEMMFFDGCVKTELDLLDFKDVDLTDFWSDMQFEQ